MLAIGRAMMAEPGLLLLDEPSLGLAPIIVETIFSILETLNQDGLSILLVEQNAVEALDLAALRSSDACGYAALRVGLAWAQGLGYEMRLLDLRDSSDTAGDPERVVGYGAFGIVEGGR